MKLLLWNCRGAGNEDFQLVLRDLVSLHDPVLMVETKISGVRADIASYRIGFGASTRVEARGFFGGIWVVLEG